MKPYYQDLHTTIYSMDFRKNDLPDECVQCVVTSPPYWGLRKYSGEQELIWGGDNHCEHQWGKALTVTKGGIGQQKGLKGNTHIAETWDESQTLQQGNFCSLCGAWKGAYGLEPTPEMYIEHTIEILREIRRVLRKDGVVFWNIGDSYSGSGQDSGKVAGQKRSGGTGIDTRSVDIIGVGEPVTRLKHPILKPKDLCLIPFRVAIAAQEDGWWVRSVIIWSKPNPMPESVTDRPTESHEYILLLAKGQSSVTTIKFSQLTNKATELGNNGLFKNSSVRDITRLCVNLATSILNSPYFQEDLCLLLLNPEIRQEYNQAISSGLVGDLPSKHLVLSNVARFLHGDITAEQFLKQLYSSIVNLSNSDIFLITGGLPFVGNTPSVYSDGNGTITIQHASEICKLDFIHNLIIAQKPTTCKYYWDADAVREPPKPEYAGHSVSVAPEREGSLRHDGGRSFNLDGLVGRNIRTVWEFPTQPYPEAHFAVFPEKLPEICIKASSKPQDIVLDPFMGAGTTLWVAKKLNRQAIGYEISEEYCKLAVDRLRQQVML